MSNTPRGHVTPHLQEVDVVGAAQTLQVGVAPLELGDLLLQRGHQTLSPPLRLVPPLLHAPLQLSLRLPPHTPPPPGPRSPAQRYVRLTGMRRIIWLLTLNCTFCLVVKLHEGFT